MLHAFIDESYSDDWFYLAAAIGESLEQMESLDADFTALIDRACEQHGLHTIDELHTYDLFQGAGAWARVPLHDRLSVAGQALGILNDHGVRFVIRGLDRTAQRRRYANAFEPYPMILTHVLREVNKLASAESQPVRMVCDEVHQHDRHRAMLERHRIQGTPGYNTTTLGSVVGALEFTASQETPMIQAADLVAYLAHRRASRPNPQRAERRARDSLWRIIEARVVHEYCWAP